MIDPQLPNLLDVPVGELPPERLLSVAAEDDRPELEAGLQQAKRVFAGRTVWNVNSTAQGGGVAEMLQSLVPYARGAGVDARWVVIQGEAGFFEVTKRIHNNLHGAPGDGGALDESSRDCYELVTRANAQRLAARVAPGDVVLLHDPQTAGLIPLLRDRSAAVVWRCHVGVDRPNDLVRRAWDFLRPYVEQADAAVFSSPAFVWEGLDQRRLSIIAPSIDPFAPKNYELDTPAVARILSAAALEDNQEDGTARFARADGRSGQVMHRSEVAEMARINPGTALVVQVSRWDRLKDPVGVLRGFVDHVAPRTTAHLVLAGPAVTHVTDDPEGLEVCEEVHSAWRALDAPVRARIHLATLQMDDPEENAVVVNALQRRAQVVVQKSVAEGFGLTVAEAMWKGRPVVASGIGGIRDQIQDGVSGRLVDATDLAGYGAAVSNLLLEPAAAERMGRRAQERVRRSFLGSRHLLQYLLLLGGLIDRAPESALSVR